MFSFHYSGFKYHVFHCDITAVRGNLCSLNILVYCCSHFYNFFSNLVSNCVTTQKLYVVKKDTEGLAQ